MGSYIKAFGIGEVILCTKGVIYQMFLSDLRKKIAELLIAFDLFPGS